MPYACALTLLRVVKHDLTPRPSYRLEPDDIAGFDQLVPDFIAVTADMDDPRLEARTRHAFSTILFVCLSASMAGAKSVHAFGEFAEDAWTWVTESLGPEIGPEPVSHDTIGRLLQKLRPDILEHLLTELTARREADDPVLAGERAHQISIDGKRQLGTARKCLMNLAVADGGQQPFTTVSTYGVDFGLVLGCHMSTSHGAEHDCVARVLAMIDLRGACVSMDAGNAYPKFCRAIREGGGDYRLCIKGNNARTRELSRQVFDARVDRAYDSDEATDTARDDRYGSRRPTGRARG